MEKKSPNKVIIFIAFALSTLNVFTAIGSMNIILPILTQEFGVTTGQISLIPLAYATMISGLTLPFGRLGDRLGHYNIYLVGGALYTFGCLLNALFSTSFWTLLSFRLVMGVGASMVQAVSQVLLIRSLGAERRGLAVGLNSSVVAFSNVISPTLGSIIAGSVGWRFIFWLNVPVGIIALILGARFLKKEKGVDAKNDLPGTVTFVVFLVAILLFFNADSLGAEGVVRMAMLAAGVASLVLFIVWERRCDSPLIQLNFFKNPAFTSVTVVLLLQYSVSYALSTCLPFYLADVLAVPTEISGLVCMSFPIMMAIFATTFGSLSDRIGSFPLILGGLSIELISLIIISTYRTETSLPLVVGSQLLFGFGSAMLSSPCFNVMMGAVPAEYSGVASGLLATMRSLGTAVGTSVFGLVIAQRSLFYQQTQSHEGVVFSLAQRDMVWGLFVALVVAVGMTLLTRRLTKKRRAMAREAKGNG